MDNIIKAEDYKGTNIEKSFFSTSPVATPQAIRTLLDERLEKGLITQEQFTKANEQLDNLIKGGRKTGAGSRGGKIIGYTKSGKPIYQSNDYSTHKDFTKQDHRDAIKVLDKKHEEALRSDPHGKGEASEIWNQHSHHRNMVDIITKEEKHFKEKSEHEKKSKNVKLGDIFKRGGGEQPSNYQVAKVIQEQMVHKKSQK